MRNSPARLQTTFEGFSIGYRMLNITLHRQHRFSSGESLHEIARSSKELLGTGLSLARLDH